MKTHRPWQPHMSTPPLFNPFTPSGHTTLDQYDMVEEEETDETTAPEDLAVDQATDPPPLMKRD
jgi:hypothetical protein